MLQASGPGLIIEAVIRASEVVSAQVVPLTCLYDPHVVPLRETDMCETNLEPKIVSDMNKSYSVSSIRE